jgi:predicted alpha-1,2-mannosidase
LHSYDSWALSEFARELGKSDIADRFGPEAKNYQNVWHPEFKFFLPRDSEGKWIEIDPKFEGGDYYNENNGYSYLWYVQHDIKGLIGLMGGEKNFEQRLDQYFTERLGISKMQFWRRFGAMTGLIGQFAMGNQVTFFIPYFYNYTSSPWKTQKMTRLLLDTWFKDDNIYGVPGDEDAGSMASFVVFSAMGFYPITPGIPMYSITSPVFSKVTIDLPNGKTFTVIAKNSSTTNKYIQSAAMNGKTLDSPWFSHEELINGGKLVLEMGEKPGKIWVNN